MQRSRCATVTTLAALGLSSLAVAGDPEFEYVPVDLPELATGYPAAINAAGQVLWRKNDDCEYALTLLEHVDGAWSVTPVAVEGCLTVMGAALNDHGDVAFVSMVDDLVRVSRWSADTGEEVLFAAPPPLSLSGFVMTNAGDVFRNTGTEVVRDTSGGPEVIGLPPVSPGCSSFGVAASPAGRVAAGYGEGFFCTAGSGLATWTSPDDDMVLSGVLMTAPGPNVRDMNDAGEVIYFDNDALTTAVYDVDTGVVNVVGGGSPVAINNDGWILTSTSGPDLLFLRRGDELVPLHTLIDGATSANGSSPGGGADLSDNGFMTALVTADDWTGYALVRPMSVESDPADVTGDGVIDFNDIITLLAAWGPCDGCPADVDGDGVVGFSDVLAVLSSWD